MGQYFRAINLDSKEYVSPYDFGSFAKLMEHAYVGNHYVTSLWYLLAHEWNGNKVVWSGDYSDHAEYEWGMDIVKTSVVKYMENMIHHEARIIAPQGSLILNQYEKEIIQTSVFVNYTKEVYCSLNCCEEDQDGWRVNPVPLLLVNSNGRGGGDYFVRNDHIGVWAYDCVGIIPTEEALAKGFSKVSVNFPMDM